jgi:hypothetical protein
MGLSDAAWGLQDEESTYHARHSVRKLATGGTGRHREKLNCDGSPHGVIECDGGVTL